MGEHGEDKHYGVDGMNLDLLKKSGKITVASGKQD